MLGLLKRNTGTDYNREVKLTSKLTPARLTLHEVESTSISDIYEVSYHFVLYSYKIFLFRKLDYSCYKIW